MENLIFIPPQDSRIEILFSLAAVVCRLHSVKCTIIVPYWIIEQSQASCCESVEQHAAHCFVAFFFIQEALMQKFGALNNLKKIQNQFYTFYFVRMLNVVISREETWSNALPKIKFSLATKFSISWLVPLQIYNPIIGHWTSINWIKHCKAVVQPELSTFILFHDL